MGLDTSHDCWHGPYSYFAEWRAEIATAAGRPVEPVEKRGPRHVIDEQDWEPGNFQGEWTERPVDVLDVLLVHSDCDGIIPTRFCVPLAQRLEELAPHFGSRYKRDDWRYQATMQFVSGLYKAAALHEDVDFH